LVGDISHIRDIDTLRVNMRATVVEVRANGLILRIEDTANGAEEAWLPSDEWSSNSSEWDLASLAIDPGTDVDVVRLPEPIEGRAVVSRKGFTLRAVDGSWENDIREMRVSDVGRTLIRGTIGDDLPAVANRPSYLDWIDSKRLITHELSDHAVLGRGDVIRGLVRLASNLSESIELDICEHLELRSAEIAEAVEETLVLPAKRREESVALSPRKLGGRIAAAVSPVLLVENNAACRESIGAVLKREGVDVHTLENTDQAHRFVTSLSPGTGPKLRKPFKLAIVDPNLDAESTDHAGLQVAQILLSQPACRVILITGEVKNIKKIDNWGDLRVHGYVEKPFSMNRLVDAINEALGLDKPVPLKDWIRTEYEESSPGGRVESRALTHETSDLSMREALQGLGRLKAGAVIHVFELQPRSFRARSLAFWGIPLKWELLQGKIAKSVIRDTAFEERFIVESNVSLNPAAHLWTLQMMKYQSFLGAPVQVKGRHIALVAFHPDARAFDDAFVAAARLTAEQVARAVERQTLYDTRRNEATFASFGMALASLAHELASDLTALDANLGVLEDMGSSLSDPFSPGNTALETLKKIRKDVADISDKTRTLRGSRAKSDRVSIINCLSKAATACRTVVAETIKQPERILIHAVEESSGSWDVAAPAASLIVVFFNLYLNAAQQIDLASSVRKHGEIWNSLTRFEDALGKAWARIRIHDSGPGIHHDDWERVFEPGYSTKPGGSGLGLYICRHLLRDLSASLLVTSSAIWDGTTITVNLPLAPENTRG
jgi:signal transduction histidine kinase/CheY-like chemotaxis protein